MTEQQNQAYCVKCKTKRDMQDPQAVYTKTGTPGTKGKCAVCGTTLFRMGRTEAHAHVPKPEIVEKPKRQSKKKAKKKSPQRRGRLVIVESPAKARTVGRFLGKGYTVKASIGHVRDLLRSQLSVDVENDFAPKYRVPNEKREVVKELRAAAATAKEIFLATDPDREGEAIAWHLIAAAEMEEERVHRVVFHEITKRAIEEAFAEPREINMDLINAQQARRILDRLVGYNITELLWAKVRNRLSAGRVQSVALRLAVDREREIDAFVSQEYWTLDAELAKLLNNGAKQQSGFVAKLAKINGEDVDFHVEGDVQPHLTILEQSVFTVKEAKNSTRQRKPTPPFTTSTMQQESSRRLRFTARRTMSVAQQLYEGIETATDNGMVGLITYMRTDSTSVAAEAQAQAREFVIQRYGAEFVPEKPPIYKTKAKSAQEAHEAIRPTSVERTPESLKDALSRDQHRLYALIWQRFVASQMANALYATRRVDILAGLPDQAEKPYLFRASGSVLKFQGFLKVYEEARDEDAKVDENGGHTIPELSAGEKLDMLQLLPKQHFTQPPPRFTEATLVRALEENGIGRPSTYAPTVAVIQNRDYVTREDRHLVPTEVGLLVNDLLVEYFSDIVNINFTAQLEGELDQVADGKGQWVSTLHDFYDPFAQRLEYAKANMPDNRQEELIGRACPECEDGQLLLRYGRFGKFIGCTNYPECRYTEPWLEKIGVTCPTCGGDLIEKKTRKKRTFYGCANYPECEFTSWKRPLPQPCENCGGLLVQQTKQEAQCTVCESRYRLDELPEVEPVADAAVDGSKVES